VACVIVLHDVVVRSVVKSVWCVWGLVGWLDGRAGVAYLVAEVELSCRGGARAVDDFGVAGAYEIGWAEDGVLGTFWCHFGRCVFIFQQFAEMQWSLFALLKVSLFL